MVRESTAPGRSGEADLLRNLKLVGPRERNFVSDRHANCPLLGFLFARLGSGTLLTRPRPIDNGAEVYAGRQSAVGATPSSAES